MSIIQPTGLDHVVLRVSDLNRSITFYGEVLGCPVERRLDELGLVQLRAGQSLIDLVELESALGSAGGGKLNADARNMDHFAVSLESFDENAIRAHLTRFDVEAGPTERRYGAGGYGPSIYLRDPDGNQIELKGPSEPDAEQDSADV
jgi:glyoxylase I family protein